MFEKRKIKVENEELAALERIELYSKRKYATKIYIPEFDKIYNINSLGVISFVENGDLLEVMEESEIKRKFDDKTIKLYREKKNEMQKETT